MLSPESGYDSVVSTELRYLPAMTSTTGNFRCQICVLRYPSSGNLSQVAGAVAPGRPGLAKPLAVDEERHSGTHQCRGFQELLIRT